MPTLATTNTMVGMDAWSIGHDVPRRTGSGESELDGDLRSSSECICRQVGCRAIERTIAAGDGGDAGRRPSTFRGALEWP